MRLGVLLLTAALILAGAWIFTTSSQVVSSSVNIVSTAGVDVMGEVQDTPTTYTILDRLKTIASNITGLTPPGVAAGTPQSDTVTTSPAGYTRRDTMSAGTGVANGDIGVPGMDQYGATQVVITSAGAAVALASDGTEDVAEAGGVTGPVILSVRRDTPVTSSGTTGDYSTFNTNSRGGTWFTPLADPAGGALPLSYTSAGATEDEHAVCTAPCTIYSILITNTNAAVRYFRCNNDTAANTAPGSETLTTNGGGGTQVIEAAVPGSTTGAGFAIPLGAAGAYFSTAATCWMVTGAAITDVAEVAANELKVFYTYRQ